MYKYNEKGADELNIAERAEFYEQELIEHRRWLHRHAELAWKEFETTEYIENYLKELGLEPLHLGDMTGCYAYIRGGQAGPDAKTILLRADIDAMEGQDKKDVPYASEHTGVVHMCGHDSHTAMLMVAAKILLEMKDELKGNVKLVFQPAEEFAYGAKEYVDAGVTDDVHAAFAEHVWMEGLRPGEIAAEKGPCMAGGTTFKIMIHGKMNHTGAPHLASDAIMAAAKVIENLQLMQTKMIDPLDSLVVAVGKMQGGVVCNAYADEAVLEGTIRTTSREFLNHSRENLERVVGPTVQMLGCTADIEMTPYMPPVLHEDDKFTELVRNAAEKLYGSDFLQYTPISIGCDDFAYFLEKVPGVYARLGTDAPEKGLTAPLHDVGFDLDESIMKRGAAMYAQVAVDYLNE